MLKPLTEPRTRLLLLDPGSSRTYFPLVLWPFAGGGEGCQLGEDGRQSEPWHNASCYCLLKLGAKCLLLTEAP